jgi:nickel/cobalt exporter
MSLKVLSFPGYRIPALCLAVLLIACAIEPALAQAKNPFSVGISEGGGSASGVTGWILSQQGWFEHQLSATVRAAKADGSALWSLVGLSLVYGVFHAAGPGHGKAVLASYMVANERALQRGIALSFLAALLQGLVAIALVGVLALVLHATAQRMKDAASLVETLSFVGIACLGAWLVWRKARALAAAWRSSRLYRSSAREPELSVFGAAMTPFEMSGPRTLAFAGAPRGAGTSRFICAEGDTSHDPGCVHCHGPDPATLGGRTFSWKEALLTVFAAGSRPCSGAILVLVFALAQGMFSAGVASVFAMSFGVAITTAVLASIAVLAKGMARRLSRPGSRKAVVLLAALEFVAAGLVLVAGVSLLAGYAMVGGA